MWRASKWDVGLQSLSQPAEIKNQTPNYQGAGRTRWLLSVIPAGAEPSCVCVWNLLRLWLGSKHGSCTLLAGETPQASQCKQQVLPVGEALHPLSLFLQLCVSCPCLGWNVQPCYGRAFPRVHGSSFNVQGNAKEPECKVLYIQHDKAGFFRSDVCLKVTKAHAEAWLGLLPPVPSLHTTANCNVQWEKTLQN